MYTVHWVVPELAEVLAGLHDEGYSAGYQRKTMRLAAVDAFNQYDETKETLINLAEMFVTHCSLSDF